MNSFGRIFRVQIFGESHGDGVGVVIDGCPAGLDVPVEDFLSDMERRKGGTQKGATPRKEDDIPIFKSGVFNGKTTGFPIMIFFENKNTRSGDYDKQRSFPRPGHADFVAHKKFGGFEDYRGGGHFSARLTTGLVAAGVIAKKLLNDWGKTSPLTPLQRRGEQIPGYITNTKDEWKILSVYAKANRKNPTEAEAMLWEVLRNRNILNCKFRRQHPIAGYLPDFVCLERKLIIEIDGQYHEEAEQQQYDNARAEWLEAYGYGIVRLTNEEVLTNLQECIDKIEVVLKEREHLRVEGLHSSSPKEMKRVEAVTVSANIIEIAGEADLEKGLQKGIDAKDSVGGIIECRVNGLPVGLGEPHFDSVESLIAHAMFTIPAVKGVEFGSGFGAAKMFGSKHNDAIENMEGKTSSNHAGGIVGGITNGNELVFRIAIKPTASTPKEQHSLNWETGTMEDFSVKGRHDLCVALRAPVIVEAATAIVLTDLMMLENKIPRIV